MFNVCRHLAILLLLTISTGCTTLAVSPEAAQQKLSTSAAEQLNVKLNTIQDGQTQVWHSEDGRTEYQLVTHDTHVNTAGIPCRSYALRIDQKYHRTQTTSGLICRDNGQWQITS